MTPERWRQIEEIFNEALELGGKARAKFLKQASGDNVDLRSEVERLLSQYDEASDFIEEPLYIKAKSGILSELLDESVEDPMVGKVLGNYRIEREVGRGGMGTVYEAFRADGEFRLRVALKVVKRGIDTDFVLKRFRNERQILAALDHSFITRLIDGGTTDDGRPYFVMEFIDGMPLYRYCDKHKLSIRDRLALFCRITEAVEYAHDKLVIHRDIKPSNIFVVNDGNPRLLDFGIAKLLDPDMASDTLQPTITALRMMTVDYASPEQVRGEKVTFGTDIYSLGVILFELLTGRRPYRLTGRSPHEVAKAICDYEPSLPSEAFFPENDSLPILKVNSSATTLIEIAGLRRDTPDQLSADLRGNIDNIILKALRKDPAERHESVAAFRDQIVRHLNGELIPNPAYYVRRANASPAERQAKLVAVLPLSFITPTSEENTDAAYLTLGLADAIITRLASVRKLTVRPTSSITRYNEHLINPFRAGLELGVDFVLDGRIRLFGDRLRISLQLLDMKGSSAIWAGQFDEHLSDVLELEDAISKQVAAALIPHLTGEEKQKLAKRGTNDPHAHAAYLRGRFYWNQFTLQSFSKAKESFERAIESDPEYALAYVGLADFYIWANIYGIIPNSEYYENAAAAAMRALEFDDQLGEAYASMGLIIMNQFGFEEAEKLILKSIGLVPNYPLSHEWYSAILVSTGRIDEAIREIKLAEELDPLSLRSKTLSVWTYYQVREFETALELADEIISFDENYPQGHIQRGNILCELERGEEAVAAIEHGIALMPGSSMAHYYLCFALRAAGRQDEAVQLVEKMKLEAATGYVKPMFLGLACVAAGQFDEALDYLEMAVDECDPWLVWLSTESKLNPIRSDPRFLKLRTRIRRTSRSRHVMTGLDSEPTPQTNPFFADANTSLDSEMPTLQYRPGFLTRHLRAITVVGIIAAALIVAYSSGIITGSVNSGGARPELLRPANVSQMVAVMPFENATGDPANDYLSDGISENLINQMANSAEIRIISRAAAFGFRDKPMDPAKIGRELGVDSIVVGSVTKRGNDFIVDAEALNVANGQLLFSMQFVEASDRIFALPMVVSSRIIESINVRTVGPTPMQKSYTENNEAFQLYLKGEFHRQKSTPDDLRRSIEFYEKALENDPNYALAYQGLALAYRSSPAYGSMTPQEAYPKAKQAAQKALSLDPNLSTAFVSLASIKATFDWDFPGAEIEYKKAIQLGPNNAEAHLSYGNFLVAMNRVDEALIEYRYAQQLDPLSLNIPTNIGWAMYIAGRNDEALVQIRQVLIRDPSFARAHMNLGEILQEQAKYDEAIAALKKAKELSRDPLVDMALGHAYATAGKHSEARKIAIELEEKVRNNEVSPFLPAVVFAGLKEKDKSFYWLERAFQERSNWLTLIKVGRRLKNLNGDPRFDDLLSRIGFAG